jgi:hypothetical protein
LPLEPSLFINPTLPTIALAPRFVIGAIIAVLIFGFTGVVSARVRAFVIAQLAGFVIHILGGVVVGVGTAVNVATLPRGTQKSPFGSVAEPTAVTPSVPLRVGVAVTFVSTLCCQLTVGAAIVTEPVLDIVLVPTISQPSDGSFVNVPMPLGTVTVYLDALPTPKLEPAGAPVGNGIGIGRVNHVIVVPAITSSPGATRVPFTPPIRASS